MGYRSEVAIQLEKKAFDMVMKSIKKYNKTQNNGWEFAPDSILKKDDDYLLQWDCIKWYSDYSDIRTVENVLNELDKLTESENIDGYRYHFVRVGESWSDIEIRSNDDCYGNCFPETHIYIDDDFREISNE